MQPYGFEFVRYYCHALTPGLDQFGDTILFTTDDDILEAMSRYDETFLTEAEGPDKMVYEEKLQRPRTADGEGDERPFTQAGFREEDLMVHSNNINHQCF